MPPDQRIATSADHPFVIENPSLAFMNLMGGDGRTLVEQDRAALAPAFATDIQVAEDSTPKCDVLFFYGALDASTRVTGFPFFFRDLVRAAGARIAVLASESPPTLVSNPQFARALGAIGDWPANIVITTHRNGENFGRFFRSMFSQMQAGVSMPMAWVALAPQGPMQPSDVPGTICLMEAGHVAFGARSGSASQPSSVGSLRACSRG